MADVKGKIRKRVWIDSQTEEEILRGIREAKDLSEYDQMCIRDRYYGWISPESFSPSVLNQYETANVEFLKNYEYMLDPKGYILN